jgi:hypothetical protein
MEGGDGVTKQQRNEPAPRDWRDERDDDDKDVPVDEHPSRDEYDRLAREFRG